MRLYLGLTYDCQLNCNHCGVSNYKCVDKKDLSFEEIKTLFFDLKKTGKFDSLSLFGGEPTLRSDLFDIIKLGKECFGYVTLDSNGLKIDLQYAIKLKESGLDVLFVSLDVFDLEKQDLIRCDGYFNNTLKVFKICKSVELDVHSSVMVTDEFVESGDFDIYVKNIKSLVDGVRVLFPCKSGNNSETLSLDNRNIVSSYFNDFIYFEYPGNESLGCSSGLVYFSPYGDVQLCPYVPITYGSIRECNVIGLLDGLFNNSVSKLVWESKSCVMLDSKFVSNFPNSNLLVGVDAVSFSRNIMLVNIKTKFNFYENSFLGYPYSLLKVGGQLKKEGLNVTLIDCMARNYSPVDFVNFLKGTSLPDEIWFSLTFTYAYKSLSEYISLIRKNFPSIKIVVGGIYPTLCPEHANSLDVDEIHVGDYNDSSMSWSDLSLLDVPYEYDVLQFSRGCPNKCTYCASSIIADKYVARDYLDLVDEIEFKLQTYNIHNFRFIDENILINFKNGFGKVLDEVSKRNLDVHLSFWNSSDYRYYNIDVLTSLKNSNFDSRFFLMAYESSSSSTNKKFKRLNFDLNKFLNTLKFAENNGFVPYANSFVGFPGQKIEENILDIVFLSSLGVLVLLSPFTLIPGTEEYTKRLPDLLSKKIDLSDLTPCNYLDADQDRDSFKKLISFYLSNFSLSGVLDVYSKEIVINLIKKYCLKYVPFLWDCYYYLHNTDFISDVDEFYYDFSNVNSFNSVLDVGSGLGLSLNMFSSSFDLVDAIDFSKYAITSSKKNNLLNVNYILGDFLDYDFGSKTYDLVFDRFTFNSIVDVEKYISKVNTLLNDGAIFKLTVIQNSTFDLSKNNFMLRLSNRYYNIFALKSLFNHLGFKILVEEKLYSGDSNYGTYFELKKIASPLLLSGFKREYTSDFYLDLILDGVDLNLENNDIKSDFYDILVRYFKYFVDSFDEVLPIFYKKVFGRNVVGCFVNRTDDKFKSFEKDYVMLKADVSNYDVFLKVKPIRVDNEFLKSLFWDDSCFDYVSDYYNSSDVVFFLLKFEQFKMEKYGLSYETKFIDSNLSFKNIDSVKFESTYSCNMNCDFCFNKNHFDNFEKMNLDDVKKTIYNLNNRGIKNLTITGGEPFLREDLFDIILYAKSLKMVVSLYTNATLIKENDFSFLAENVSMVLISLHSLTEKEFEIKVSAIKKLRDLGVNVLCCTIGSDENLQKLDVFMNFFNCLNVPWMLTRPIPVKDYSLGSLDLQKKSLVKLSEFNVANGTNFRFGSIPYCALDPNLISSISTEDVQCSAFNSFVMDPLGKISSCEANESKTNFVSLNNLSDDFLKNVPLVCKNCIHFSKCHSGCRYIASKFGKDGLDPLANPKNVLN